MLGLGNDLVGGSGSGYRARFSLDLDGTGDIMITDDIQAILRGSWTINYWMRLDDSTPSGNAMCGLYHDTNNQIALGVHSSGAFNFYMEADAVAVAHTVHADLDGGGTTLSGNSQSDWFMVTLTCTLDTVGSDPSTFAMYSNANAISTDKTLLQARHVAFSSGGTGYGFGARNSTAVGILHPLDGNITECAIWNTPLDADAVTALYNSGASLNPMSDSGSYDNSSALVRYYDFDQGVGTTVTDQTGNANGTIQGNPTYAELHPRG